jgi:PAS domain S-box-containing protein
MTAPKNDPLTSAVEALASEKPEISNLTEVQSFLQGLAGLSQSSPNSQAAANYALRNDFAKPLTLSHAENFDVIYRVLTKQIPAVVFLAFLDEGIGQAYVSPHIETVLGFSQEEWLDDPVRWFKQIHADDKQRWSIEAAQMLLSGQPLQSVYRVIARDGRIVWFQCDARMIRHDNGEPWLIHGVAFDITELKRSQEELQHAHDELERRVQQRTMELNRTIAALETEIAQRERAQAEVQELNRTLETRVLERTEELNKVNAELVRDIAERKRLEQQLLQAQKMESIGTLAGGIAHDFNNLLNVIQGYACDLGQPSAEKEKIAESAAVIQDAVKRGAALVGQLLTVARKTEPKLTLTDLHTLVDGLTGLLKQTMPKNIELITKASAGLPSVKVDMNQITQVLLNLCINARDAMPEGGKLTIRTCIGHEENVRSFEKASSGEFVCIEVSDTGVGMDETIQRRIFEPFFTTKGPGRGTGLGLSVAYGIVANHGGSIYVESKPMCGTTFRLYLPVRASQDDELATEVSEGPSLPVKPADSRGTILLVEDEQPMLSLLEKILSRQGYHVFAALDGESAIEIFRRHKHDIDAVLLDIGLPRVSGWEVFLQMKREEPNLRAVIASGYLEPDLQNNMQSAGISHVINKPYVPDDVLKVLEDLMSTENRKAPAPAI